ncbi:MAG: hypothetical protein RIQ47_651 [Bacteroidota bacterium]|jgi:hypothetical protein
MIKKLYPLFIFVCILASRGAVSAQSNQHQELAIATVSEKTELNSNTKAAPGTYQFIVDPKGLDEVFTNDILVIAELLRQDNETAYHKLSPNVTLKIISRKEVAEQRFVDEFLILKNEK